MSKLYLITGFLGAGKTTFLKQFVRLFPGQRVALVVNEFGREGVDGALLAELGLVMTEIDNGSIFCACRAEQFRDALLDIAAQAPDVIVVEASGLSDPTDVGRLLDGEAFGGVDYAGAVCLVDGARFHKVWATARVCKKQLAVADAVVVNKTDLAAADQLAFLRAQISALRPGVPVVETSFGRVDGTLLTAMAAPRREGAVPGLKTQDLSLQKRTLEVAFGERAALFHFLALFAEDTYRVKGFVILEEGPVLVDCVGPLIQVTPYGGVCVHPNRLTVLFGNGLPGEKSLKTALSSCPEAKILP